MPALDAYRALLRATGPFFLLLSFAARLPNGMGPLGVLTLVAATSGSYGTAGLAAGAFGLGSAAGGPVVGWLADRHGQRLVGCVTAVLDAAAFAGVVVAATAHLPAVAVVAVAAFAGLSTPQVGPFMRLRWVALLAPLPAGIATSGGPTPAFPAAAMAYRRSPRLLSTAFSYEGAVDEVSYVAGPALVGVLALLAPGAVPMLVAAGLVLVCGVAFALHRSAPGTVRPAEHRGIAHAALPVRSVASLVGGLIALGFVLGGVQTAVSVLARSEGEPGAAGLIYAVLGLASAAAGVATAWLPRAFGYLNRYVAAGALLALTAGALLAIRTPVSAVAVLAVLGLLVGPYLITGYALAEQVAPRGRGGVVMTLMASGVMAGVAAGAGAAGALGDVYGYV
ncbi:MAG: MFS transporter, partial [Actinocatenispora sp.]